MTYFSDIFGGIKNLGTGNKKYVNTHYIVEIIIPLKYTIEINNKTIKKDINRKQNRIEIKRKNVSTKTIPN